MIHYMNNNNNINIEGWWILDHNNDSDNYDEIDDSDTDDGNDDSDDDDSDDDDANFYDKIWWFDNNLKIN